MLANKQRINNIQRSIITLIDYKYAKPFIFRTRYERLLLHIIKFSKESADKTLLAYANNCMHMLKNVSDKSNMTSDGVCAGYKLFIETLEYFKTYFSNLSQIVSY